MDISTKLLLLREAGEGTAKGLCQKLKINESDYFQFESGNKIPNYLQLIKIAGYYKIDVCVLLPDENIPIIKYATNNFTISKYEKIKLEHVNISGDNNKIGNLLL